MFDLALTVHGDVAPARTVEDQSPELDEELAVPRVAPVDLDVDLATVGGVCSCRRGAVADRHGRRRGLDADRAQRRGEVVERRGRVRRPEREMHQRAGGPADRQRSERLDRRRLGEDHRGQPGEADQPPAELAQRVDEVGIGHGDRGGAGRECERRERHCIVDAPDPVEQVRDGVVDDPVHECDAGRGDHQAHCPVAQQPPAPAERGEHRDDDDPDLDEVVGRLPEEVEQGRQR